MQPHDRSNSFKRSNKFARRKGGHKSSNRKAKRDKRRGVNRRRCSNTSNDAAPYHKPPAR